METFYLRNPNTVTWQSMNKATDGSYANDETVTASLQNTADEVPVTGFESLSLPNVAGSNGKYQGTVLASVLAGVGLLGAHYTLVITSTKSGATDATRRLPAQIIERTT
jgi:hypothetical protein